MRVVLQRVSEASVSVDGRVTGSIGAGYAAFIGIGAGDDEVAVEKMADKIKRLRLFADANGKTNLSITDVGGGLLIVSQFTLYADCRKGNRPSFTDAADPAAAERLYDYFVAYARDIFNDIAHGVFGADMQVALVNDGPFTVVLEG